MRPIIIVTGANGGVGFGICHRLLFQLCQTNPTDALPQSFASQTVHAEAAEVPSGYDGLTLIMACRSTARAEAARAKLFRLLDAHIEELRRRPGYSGHAHVFQKNVQIDIQYLDLAVIGSIFKLADEVSQKYPYISHLICNAGGGSFSGIAWPACFRQLFADPMSAITAPTYYRQHAGEISVDGLGWVWQCNVFGHYVLFRSLQHLMSASQSPLGARVIWVSSLEASPTFYQSEDWQLKRTEHSYESTKYQTDLLATHLDRLALLEGHTGAQPIRHFVSQPGVCSTNVGAALVGPVLDMLKVVLFYLGRLCGSPHHTIEPFKAAVVAVHLSLTSLAFITFFSGPSATNGVEPNGAKTNLGLRPVKFGAETDRWGAERVGLTEVKDWEAHKDEGEDLVKKCKALFETFKKTETAPANFETASEHM